MGRIYNIWYAIFLVVVFGLFALGRLNDGHVLIMSFDGDALHMTQTALRMAAGETPHLDFQTPLGAMAFLPITTFLGLGYDIGHAFAYAPVLIGFICLPALYWVAISRFNPFLALAYTVVFMALLLSYLHGGLKPTVTASMYYNNWCWAVSMLVVAVAILPGPDNRSAKLFEALILGFGLGFLTLTKATYAVFLLPGVVLALVGRQDWVRFVAGLFFGLMFLTVFTLPLGGFAYWAGYIGDLRAVIGSNVRQNPGVDLSGLLISPQYVAGSFGLIAAVIFLRQAKLAQQGLLLLMFGVGWILITYQNWQNDPHWLALAGLLLLPMSREITLYNRFGWPLKNAIHVVAVGLLFTGLPLTYAQVQSVLVHTGLNADKFAPAMIVADQTDGIWFRKKDSRGLQATVPNPALAGPVAKPAILAGETLPECGKVNGLVAGLQETGRRIDAIPDTSGKTALYADWVNAVWLFSGLEPLPNGAPWYYGGAPGFANADYLIVPLCPMGPPIRRIILEQLAADPELIFEEVSRDDLFILLARQPIES
ncbi:MAG: hypothetical protein GY947_17695 [Rhodobacteraceae bacterium]|nr:hypothetical protein [Paracoccaceae bacterium]